MSKARFGSFDEMLEIAEEPLRPIAKPVRDTVFKIDLNTIEVVPLMIALRPMDWDQGR